MVLRPPIPCVHSLCALLLLLPVVPRECLGLWESDDFRSEWLWAAKPRSDAAESRARTIFVELVCLTSLVAGVLGQKVQEKEGRV